MSNVGPLCATAMHFFQFEMALSARLEAMFDRPLSDLGALRPQEEPKNWKAPWQSGRAARSNTQAKDCRGRLVELDLLRSLPKA